MQWETATPVGFPVCTSLQFFVSAHHETLRIGEMYSLPPLQTPGLARDGLPGGGADGRQVTVSRGGGGGRLQGYFKANCGTLH